MRFLADENFPGSAVAALEAAGHDAVWIRLAAPGATDADVLARAAREERILRTVASIAANSLAAAHSRG